MLTMGSTSRPERGDFIWWGTFDFVCLKFYIKLIMWHLGIQYYYKKCIQAKHRTCMQVLFTCLLCL